MLSFEPTQRPTLTEVIGHPWVQAAVPRAQDIFAEFQRRQLIIKENSMRCLQAATQLSRMETTVDSGPSLQGYRTIKASQYSYALAASMFAGQVTRKMLRNHEPNLCQSRLVFCTLHPDHIEAEL